MDMDTENAEIVNRAVAEEGARSLIDIMAEKEEGLEVPVIKEKELQDFENYLRTSSALGAIMGEVRNIVLPKVVEEIGEEDDIELAGEGFTPDGLKKSTKSEVISKEEIDEIFKNFNLLNEQLIMLLKSFSIRKPKIKNIS